MLTPMLTLLNSYHVYSRKSIIEDDFSEGEVGDFEYVSNKFELCKIGLSFERAMKNAFKDLFGDENEIENAYVEATIDYPVLRYVRTETEDGLVPTEKQMKDWEKGKIKLYSAYYEFKCFQHNMMDMNKLIEY